jgi:splicing factor 3B subunit 2
MAAETLPFQNGVVANSNSSSAAVKKPKENDRRRRRRKPKKNNKTSEQPALNNNEDSDDAKENTDPKQVVEKVEIEYVPEKVDLYEGMDEEFRKIFEKFSFTDVAASEETEKKDEVAEDAVTKKKAGSDSDSDDEENENDLKDKGVSNKKKKV